ncbi:AbrB/MazE/SpoVT family DNA-binding domain-containing protein [Pseudomonas sp. TMW22090]|nr:AbrB/MazE/SpoVT family DNA-binding domain-containing protein [Pseudomonas sp. TMW22090]
MARSLDFLGVGSLLPNDRLHKTNYTLYLIEEFVGNTRCLVLSKTPRIADRIDEITETWDSARFGKAPEK